MQVTRITNTFYSSNTFVLSENDSPFVWLVDCGDYVSQIKPFLNGRTIKGILLTHTHSDHIYGLNDLLRDYPDVQICSNEFGKKALRDARLNLSKYHSEVTDLTIECEANMVVVDEGDKIDLFDNHKARSLSTPGHDESCISYIVDDYIFTGDSFIPGFKVSASFPHSNKNDALASYERLKLTSRGYWVCPGHGEIVMQ